MRIRIRRSTLTLMLLAGALGLSATTAAAQDLLKQPYAGDCSLTLTVGPTTTADALRIAIDSADAEILFKIAQIDPFVVILSDPLRESSDVFVSLHGGPADQKRVLPRPGGAAEPDSCGPEAPPKPSDYDNRATFEANAFYGLAIDNFAPSIGNYLNDVQGNIRTRWTAGVQAEYRLIGEPDDVRQFWLSTQILHGLRTADVDCTKTPDLAVCNKKAPVEDKFFAVLEHASTLEAQIDFRYEFLRLQIKEDSPVKVYASSRYGFVAVAGAPKVFSSDAYVGLGLIMPKGTFRGSFAQVSWGRSRQFQSDPNADRLKIYATLEFDVAPGLVDQARNIVTRGMSSTRFFTTIVIDRNPGGHAPDSVQTYFGLDFDVRRLVGAF